MNGWAAQTTWGRARAAVAAIVGVVAALACVVPLPAQSTDAARTAPPNVLLIMADDLGAECLGAYGGESYDTPHLDALAAAGMRFTHCYSNPKCVPSRVNILTGRYGFRTGQEWGHIPDGELTFANVLKPAGVATALAGKWQLGLLKDNPDHPVEKGFDTYSCWAWHEGPRYWDPLIWQDGALRDDDIEDRYGPEIFAEFLVNFMKAHQTGPFLAYYPMCLPHFAKTGGPYKEPPGPDGDYQTYKEMVERMDTIVGGLVDALENMGLREQTLVLFTADNGTPGRVVSRVNGRAMRGGKGDHTDAGTRVPLIASWPGTTPAGATCDDLVDFSDFMPTLAELFDASLPDDRVSDGQSFLPQLKGLPGNPREWAYTEFEGLAWIRTKRFKLYSDGRFFDMQADPLESDPLDTSTRSDEAARAKQALAKSMRDLRNGPTPGGESRP